MDDLGQSPSPRRSLEVHDRRPRSFGQNQVKSMMPTNGMPRSTTECGSISGATGRSTRYPGRQTASMWASKSRKCRPDSQRKGGRRRGWNPRRVEGAGRRHRPGAGAAELAPEVPAVASALRSLPWAGCPGHPATLALLPGRTPNGCWSPATWALSTCCGRRPERAPGRRSRFSLEILQDLRPEVPRLSK